MTPQAKERWFGRVLLFAFGLLTGYLASTVENDALAALTYGCAAILIFIGALL